MGAETPGSSSVLSMDRIAALYRAHFQFVWRLVRRARVPAADIDDLTHDVFLVVLQKPPTDASTKEGASTLDHERARLFRITDYKLKNYYTRARRRGTEPMDDSTNEIADAHNDAERLEDCDLLFALLDSADAPGRAVFELVELEGFSVVEAARLLKIPESTARKRLIGAQQDIEAAAKKLAKRDQETGQKKAGAFLLPFGEGAWLKLREIQNPPAGADERVWRRLQSTMEALEREDDRPASPRPRQPPLRARGRRVLRLLQPLKSALGSILSACVGGAIVALLFLLRPNASIAILRFPVPVVLVPTSTTVPAVPPTRIDTPSSPPVLPTAEARHVNDAKFADETELIRRIRAAYVTNDLETTLKALDAYETHYPTGKFKPAADDLRASLLDAGAR